MKKNLIASRIRRWLPYPLERPEIGASYYLAESLDQIGFSPFYQSYHNPDAKLLIGKSHGSTVGDKKALTIKVSEPLRQSNKKRQQFLSENSKIALQNNKAYSPFLERKYVHRLGKETQFYMNTSPLSFVHDGDAGSKNGAQVRVFTDNAAIGLYLKNILLRAKIPKVVSEHKYDALVVQSSGYELTPDYIVEEFSGPTKKDLNLEHEQFILTDEEIGQTTIAGIDDTEILLDALAYHSAQVHATRGNIALPADVVSFKGKHTLIFGNELDVANVYEDLDKLYSAHHSVLLEDGTLSRMWGGFTRYGKSINIVTENALIEELPDGTQRVTQSNPGIIPNVIDGPSSIVVLVHDKNHVIPPLARVKSDIGLDILVSGLYKIENEPQFRPGLSFKNFGSVFSKQELREKLQKLLFDKGVEIYIANSSVPEVKAAVRLVVQNELEDLKGRAVAGTQDTVRTISHKDLSSVSRKDTSKQTQDLTNLLEIIKKSATE